MFRFLVDDFFNYFLRAASFLNEWIYKNLKINLCSYVYNMFDIIIEKYNLLMLSPNNPAA
jgi:hypothetical protein